MDFRGKEQMPCSSQWHFIFVLGALLLQTNCKEMALAERDAIFTWGEKNFQELMH